MVYLPRETAVMGAVVRFVEEEEEEGEGRGEKRSPRMQAKGWMTQRPPRVICWVPWSWERRETLLPVSVSTQSGFWEVGLGLLLLVVVLGGGMVGGVDGWEGLAFVFVLFDRRVLKLKSEHACFAPAIGFRW